MAEFYKFEITNWNEGTANLSLELEAAYLRVINAIRLADQAITFNTFVLCGLWRCNDRKAKRILAELIDAGKLAVDAGKIITVDTFDAWGADARPAIPAHVKNEVAARDGRACRYCGVTDQPLEYDHVLPWSRGGQHTSENLVVSCRPCNRSKRDRTPSEMGWRL